ncbi:transporter, major facilitator family protein [Cardiosporidium cionae]|uniref:Transporter, major facilitator family protein n=1 Tax=Cardiosporidium cionae TaxID=476202 RepID=A0ABQ7JC76_9APIC|nr:transporter, major facilitator family protein [Cardiosporidium cionae]|eukprot:KAF8821600.1 transporter, major facilitator family protein [Cardiosporidium cionae]
MRKVSVLEAEGDDSSTQRVNVGVPLGDNSVTQPDISKLAVLFGIPCINLSHLNRFTLLFLYSVAVFFTGCTHWGWDGLQGLLYKSGAYAWRCRGEADISNFGNTNFIDCDSRRSTINNLYTVAVASQFAFSFCAGTIIDWAGPKLCSLLGQFFMVLGWAILSISSEKFPLYYAGVVLIGMAADTAYFPLLNLSNLFPKRESLILGVLGSIRSTSFSIPVLMRMIFYSDAFAPQDLWKIITGYVIIGIIPPILMSIFIIPMRPFEAASPLDSKNVQLVAQKATEILQANPTILVTSPSTEGKDVRRRSLRASHLLTSDISHLEVANGLGEDPMQNRRRSSRASILQSGQPVTPSFYAIEDDQAIEISGESSSKLIPFKDCVFSLPYLIVTAIFCLNLLRAEFFTKSHKDQLKIASGDVYFLFTLCNILSFTPGVIFGAICDSFGVLSAISFINVAGIGMYAFLMFNNLIAKGAAVVFMMLYISFVLSSLYCYINVTFPVYHFGKLTGISSFMGGMFTLVSIPIYSFATSSDGNFQYINAAMLVLGGIIFLLLFWTYLLQRRSHKVAVESTDKSMESVALT